MDRLDGVRSAACLAHSMPGITLDVTTIGGDRFAVSRHRLDALMDPCQFRAALVSPRGARGERAGAGRDGEARFHDAITGCEVVGGAVDLGGGLYQSTHPTRDDERWFTTCVSASDVTGLAARCPIPHDGVELVVGPDTELRVCAVRCVAPRPRPVPQLEEVAFWLLSACLADELVASVASSVRP
jgi:hypothetical protein